VDLFNKKTFTV